MNIFWIAWILSNGMGNWAGAAPPTGSADGWEKIDVTDDGITRYRRSVPGTGIVAFRGEAIMEAPLIRVAAVLDNVEREREWMADLVESYDLERKSDLDRWEYNRTAAPWPVSDRDFVIHTIIDFYRAPVESIVIAMQSKENPKKPPVPGVVRGELIDSKFILISNGPTQSLFICEILADPKGIIPTFMVNVFQKSWPISTIRALRAQIKKPDIVESPALQRAKKGAGSK